MVEQRLNGTWGQRTSSRVSITVVTIAVPSSSVRYARDSGCQ